MKGGRNKAARQLGGQHRRAKRRDGASDIPYPDPTERERRIVTERRKGPPNPDSPAGAATNRAGTDAGKEPRPIQPESVGTVAYRPVCDLTFAA